MDLYGPNLSEGRPDHAGYKTVSSIQNVRFYNGQLQSAEDVRGSGWFYVFLNGIGLVTLYSILLPSDAEN